MIALVILLKNQKNYIQGIISAIQAQTVQPDKIVISVDRCLDDYRAAQQMTNALGWSVVHANLGREHEGILIGSTRNKALELCEGYDVVFTDGDCIPSPKFIEHHKKHLKKPFPVATTGARNSQTESGAWEEDIRITKLPYKHTFSKKADRLVLGSAGDSTMVIFGCNMGMNSAAIKLIRERAQERLGERLLFASCFDGEWGFEETSLGPILYNAGAQIIALNPSVSHVAHAWHPSRGAGVRGSDVSKSYIAAMLAPSIIVQRNGTQCKKRSTQWIESCVTVTGLPVWWGSVFGHLSVRESAQVACALYPSAKVPDETSTDTPYRWEVVSSAIKQSIDGMDIPESVEEEHNVMKAPSYFGTSAEKHVKVSVVVPFHNQTHNVYPIMDALGNQTATPYEIIAVVDRCTDTTVSRIIENAHFVGTQVVLVHRDANDDGFRAGHVRNLGAEHARCERILFLDGDCVPCETWVESHVKAMDEAQDLVPVATFGLRKDQLRADSEEYRNDTRTYRSTLPIFRVGKNNPVMNRGPVTSHMATWSCNLGLNKKAVDLLKGLNNGAIFSPALTNGAWGGEDTYLGMQLWDNMGLLVAVDPEPSHVKHLWHPRATDTSGLGAVGRMRHSSIKTVFERKSADLANTVENNLIRSDRATNIPSVYFMFKDAALKGTQFRSVAERALAYLCARDIEFLDVEQETDSALAAETMYQEIIRIRGIITSTPITVEDMATKGFDLISVDFDKEIEADITKCNKCKTWMHTREGNRCPMCRTPYTN